MKCELCNKSIWWFQDDEVIGSEVMGRYLLPDGKTHEIKRIKLAHIDCVSKYGKRIDV